MLIVSIGARTERVPTYRSVQSGGVGLPISGLNARLERASIGRCTWKPTRAISGRRKWTAFRAIPRKRRPNLSDVPKGILRSWCA